jgi:hypothetical protein
LWALAVILFGSAVVAVSYWWHWRSHPYVQFPVERLEITKGSPAFFPHEEISEGRYGIVFAVRGASLRSIHRVIIDYRFDEFGVTYAFTGKTKQGVTLAHAGLDASRIVAESRWEGDPRDFVLKQPRPLNCG